MASYYKILVNSLKSNPASLLPVLLSSFLRDTPDTLLQGPSKQGHELDFIRGILDFHIYLLGLPQTSRSLPISELIVRNGRTTFRDNPNYP